MALSITVTPEMEEYIRAKVASGQYMSASEVVREGLRLHQEHDVVQQWKLEQLRADIRKGLESGPGEYISREDHLAEIHAKFNKKT